MTEQPPFSQLTRGVEADLLPVAEQYGMGVLPWSPLAGGWLTGKYRKGQDAYLAAYDVHRGKVFGRCESFGGFLAAVGGAVVHDPDTRSRKPLSRVCRDPVRSAV